jgi:hypothetical protein
MAWTYSGDPASSELDELRFTLQDTDPSLQLLQDAELEFLIEKWMPRFDSLVYVAAIAAALVARKFAGMVSVSSDGVSVNVSDLAQRYRDLAAELRAEYKDAQVGGVLDLTNLMVGTEPDPSIRPLRFGVGLHDNPEAGLQDFGGWTYDPFRQAEETAAALGW